MVVKKRTANSGSESSHGAPSKRRAVPVSVSELEQQASAAEHLTKLKLHLRRRLLSPYHHVAPASPAVSGLKGLVDQLLKHGESNSVLLLGPPSSTDSVVSRTSSVYLHTRQLTST